MRKLANLPAMPSGLMRIYITTPFKLYQHTHTTNPRSRTARNLLAKEAVALVHSIGNASEVEFITDLLFPVDEEAAFPAADVISVPGNRVIRISRIEVVGEIAKLARQDGYSAENIIRSGGVYHGMKNEKIFDGMAMVKEWRLVDGKVLLFRVGKGKFTVIQAI
ncbi:unnamed protein product [Tuber aestivum]|uniref:Uncharacterized protein n=1 Tax=Tuber aestivum TaxID=59557 RepID=A0A292Q319_9PEZI|nr:unnamed protein product [Tuber aestivum]